jgi:hypothetical protein
VRLLRFGSTAICLVVIASFVVFAVGQTKSASGRQQAELAASAPATQSNGAPAGVPVAHESSVHRTLDEVASRLTSPFAGLTSGSSSEWTARIVTLLAALLVYGFGLGYLARTLRVRM